MRVDSRPRTQLSGPVGLTILVVLVVVCGLAACGLITGPLPPGAERFAPPAVYARWWSMTEACSGHSGDLRVVQWYRVPGMGFLHEGQEASGFWGSSPNRIVLADEVIDEGSVVRHEMLHALLQKTGHPRSQFLGACASVVTCPSACVEDAGRWHAPQENYVVVPSESLEVASGIELRPPTWSWYADGSLVGTTTDPQFTVTAGGPSTQQQLEVVATDGNGHSVSGLTTVWAAAQVTISEPSQVEAGCANSWVAYPTGGTPPYTYAWTAGGASYDTGSDAQLTLAPASQGTFYITVRASDANGNVSTASLTVTVTSGDCT